jgi:4-alpha-glucanotransferase
MVQGQDWGFQPLHPRRARARGHDHWIAVLRHHLRHAGALRIDHVMGLHRLFFVPHGMTPAHGVYVRYPADELYAVATLEATRAGAALVGEDLGVVPPVVRRRLARHDWLRMFVLQFAVRPDRSPPLESIPGEALASLNTHDMPTFAGWWQGSDVGEQRARGVLDDGSTAAALAGRERVKAALVQWLRAEGLLGGEADARSVLRAALRHLVRSPAHAVIVALEDLWGETRPQNVPGTWRERPNWRRRMTRDLAAITTDAELAEVVRGCARRDP